MSGMFKRLISALLILSSLIIFASCAGSGPKVGETAESQTETEAVTENPEKPDFTGSDWGGEDFNVYILDWGLYTNYFFADEENGDAMNDVLVERERLTEETLNIQINHTFYVYSALTNTVKNCVMSGDDTYDLFLTHCIDSLAGLVTNHYLYNWNELPVVDMQKSYWNRSMNENLSVDGKLFFAVNDFMIADPNAIFFNKALAEKFGFGSSSDKSLYDVVKRGGWTLDYLSETAKGVSADINGDGIYDQNDQYGFVGENDWMFCSFMHSCDQFIVAKNEEGLPELCLNTEKTVNIVNKLYDMCFSDNRSWLYPYADRTNKYIAFDSGRALFYLVPLNGAKNYRSTDFDFGILPYPKYDEAQEHYLSTDWSGLMCAPVTLADTELFGQVMELLAYIGQQKVHPVYFDVLLSTKISRDNESQDMLDIIYDNIVYDFGLNLTNYSALLYCIPQLLQAKSHDFASFYEKNYKPVEKQIGDLVKSFESFGQ